MYKVLLHPNYKFIFLKSKMKFQQILNKKLLNVSFPVIEGIR